MAAFLLSAGLMFFASAPLADLVKSLESEFWRNWMTQVILGLPLMWLVYYFEERVIWRMLALQSFETIHPVSVGVYVGYVMHYAM